VADPGGGKEVGDAFPEPPAAMNDDACRLPPGEDTRTAVAVAVRKGCGRQLRGEPRSQLQGQRPVRPSGEVVKRPARCEQGEHAIGQLRRDSPVTGGRDYLGAVPASVEQADHPACVTHPGKREGPARINADLEGIAVPPDEKQTRLECWPHVVQRDRSCRQYPPADDRLKIMRTARSLVNDREGGDSLRSSHGLWQ